MIEKYGFFDSTHEDTREYAEVDFARWGQILAADGVRGGSDALKVSAHASGLAVSIGAGTAMLRGRYYALEDDGSGEKILGLAAATAKPRIDRIVLRLAHGKRTIAAEVLKGTEAEAPTPPPLKRDADEYMLSLAQVRVGVGVEALADESVTDERADKDVCGMVSASADDAMRRADAAFSKAEGAQKAADEAKQGASEAKSAADAAQQTANTAVSRLDQLKIGVPGGKEGDIVTLDQNGNIVDSGIAMNSFHRCKFALSGTTLTITTV